jgi:hypothetical protein
MGPRGHQRPAASRIKIRSMNFMRGRTFLNRYVIIDEAQNLTPKQMKTLLTRAGPGTKMVCLGNVEQIDTPYLTETTSGLTYAVDRFKDWAHSGAHHPAPRRALAAGGLRVAGLTVAIVALPLAMALAIASGAAPEKGLHTAIVAGFLISALGGSRVQIGGPTAAFIPVVFNVIERFGYGGLILCTLLAGLILIAAGLLRARHADEVHAAAGDHRLHRRHRGDHLHPARSRICSACEMDRLPGEFADKLGGLAHLPAASTGCADWRWLAWR